MSVRVLIAEDGDAASGDVAGLLADRGFDVRTVSGADAAILGLGLDSPHLLVVDGAPRRAAELCRRVRTTSEIPIIVVAEDVEHRGEVAALDAGADDYILKPLSPESLVARIRVRLRRTSQPPTTPALDVGAFQIDFDDRRVHVQGQRVRLTPKEFDLFVYMARHPNRVLPHRTLLGAVWGDAFVEQAEYLRVFIGQLRKKLEPDPPNPVYLLNEPCVGYRLNPTGESA